MVQRWKQEALPRVADLLQDSCGGILDSVSLTRMAAILEEDPLHDPFESIEKNPRNYDVWFDYVRLEESTGDVARIRETYERAVKCKPPVMQKRYWRRYIYLWIYYALFEASMAEAVAAPVHCHVELWRSFWRGPFAWRTRRAFLQAQILKACDFSISGRKLVPVFLCDDPELQARPLSWKRKLPVRLDVAELLNESKESRLGLDVHGHLASEARTPWDPKHIGDRTDRSSQARMGEGTLGLSSFAHATRFQAIITACARAARWRDALQILERMRSDSVQPNLSSCNSVISACERGSRWPGALALLRDLKSWKIHADVVGLNAVLKALAKASRWRQVSCLLLALQEEGVEPDLVSYTAVMDAAHRSQRWPAALHALRTLRQRRLQADVICFTTLLSAVQRSAQWRLALTVLADMARTRAQPDLICHNAALAACQEGPWQLAVAVLDDLWSSNLCPDIVSFNTAITACLRNEQWQTGLSFLEVLADKGLKPRLWQQHIVTEGSGSSATFDAATSACEKGTRWLEALAFLQARWSQESQVSGGCSGVGESPLSQAERQLQLQRSVSAVRSAARACEKAMAWQTAISLLGEASDMSVQCDETMFYSTILACSSAREWQKSFEIWHDMCHRGIRPSCSSSTLATLLMEMEQRCMWQQQVELLHPLATAYDTKGAGRVLAQSAAALTPDLSRRVATMAPLSEHLVQFVLRAVKRGLNAGAGMVQGLSSQPTLLWCPLSVSLGIGSEFLAFAYRVR
eukprot:s3406_g3.t23